jgi:hypothetical protein
MACPGRTALALAGETACPTKQMSKVQGQAAWRLLACPALLYSREMKFAKAVFWIASVFGVLLVTPLYFTFDLAGRLDPPPITHPQFYYGFVGVVLVWQFVYFTIGTDPVRFRPMMILAALAKASYVVTLLVLYFADRVSPVQAATGIPDALFIVLFAAAYVKTRAH